MCEGDKIEQKAKWVVLSEEVMIHHGKQLWSTKKSARVAQFSHF